MPIVGAAAVADAGTDEEADSHDDAPLGTAFVDDCWFRFKYNPFTSVIVGLDSVLEMYSFCFLKPVSLGLFSFHTGWLIERDGKWDR